MEAVLLIDESQGIYIPQTFYNNFDLRSWGLDPDEYTMLDDPEHEHYWLVWDEVLENAVHYTKKGVWRLDQNGDLFTYCEPILTNVRSIRFENP